MDRSHKTKERVIIVILLAAILVVVISFARDRKQAITEEPKPRLTAEEKIELLQVLKERRGNPVSDIEKRVRLDRSEDTLPLVGGRETGILNVLKAR